MPRGQFLFVGKKEPKTMSAESASLKIGYTTLKVRNLPSFLYGFEQTDFLHFVPPIFLTLTSQGGNQGILRSASYLFKRSWKSVFEKLVTAYGSLFIGRKLFKS